MKTVVKSAEVYHLWANEAQETARNGGNNNMSFTGVNAFSYSAVIGKIVRNEKDEKAFLITNNKYSVTTSGHIQDLYRAIPNDATKFTAYIDLHSWIDFNPNSNLEAMVNLIPELSAKAFRARSNREYLLHDVASHIEGCKKFAAFFGLPVPELSELDLSNFEDAKTAYQKREREQKAKADAKAKEHLQEWKDGASVFLFNFSGLRYDYMRINGEQIETTKGALVPLAHVKNIADTVTLLLDRIEKTKTAYTPSQLIRLGFYTLDKIEANGIVKVGCHSFESQEIKRIAELIKAQ